VSAKPAIDSLLRLVLRAREQIEVVRPVVAPLFAPAQREVMPVAESEHAQPARLPLARAPLARALSANSERERRDQRAASAAQPGQNTAASSAVPQAGPLPRAAAPSAPGQESARRAAQPAVAAATPSTKQRDTLLDRLFEKLDARPQPAAPAANTPLQSAPAPPTEPQRPADPHSAHDRATVSPATSEEPTVRVTIGQIVVRAVLPAPAAPAAARPARPGPSLEEYLARGARP
jgi:hypothetical protein